MTTAGVTWLRLVVTGSDAVFEAADAGVAPSHGRAGRAGRGPEGQNHT